MPDWFSQLAGPSLFWLIATVVLVALEAITVGLTSIWFAAGALAALIVSFFTDSLFIQVCCYLVVALVSLCAVRPMVKRFMAASRQPTNADRAIGAEGVVVQAVDNLNAQGQVKVDGAVWTARSSREDQIIPADTRVRVERIEGVKLIVAPLDAPAACPSDPAPGKREKEE